MKLISGSGNYSFASGISRSLNIELVDCKISKFSNDSIYIKLNTDLYSENVIIVQSCVPPLSDHILEILFIADAAKRFLPNKIYLLTPYYPYSRSDKIDESGIPLTAKVISDLFRSAHFDAIITSDLHSPQLNGFCDLPILVSSSIDLFAKDLKKRCIKNSIIISPDIGGVKRARQLAIKAGIDNVCCIEKTRTEDRIDIMTTHIDAVCEKNVILFDDEFGSGSYQGRVANELKKAGAAKILGYFCHGFLLNDAIANLENSSFDNITITDALIPQSEYQHEKIRFLNSTDIFKSKLLNILKA